MRAILATVFAVMLVWTQISIAVSPHDVVRKLPCRCCRCANPACATSATVPAPLPAPVAPSQEVVEKNKAPAPTLKPAFQLDLLIPLFDLANVRSAQSCADASAVASPPLPPLLRRHGILLI